MGKFLLVLATLVGASCAFQDITVLQWLDQSHYTTMASLIRIAGLDAQLSHGGSFTIFAPSNAAFQNLGSQLTSLQSNPSELRRVLSYHVVNEFILVPLITGYMSVHTLLHGVDITLHKITNTEAFINNGTRFIPIDDNLCNNGVVHPIDAVLFPPTERHELNIAQILIRDESKFRDFAVGCMITGILPVLETGEYTVFAPINTAFAQIAQSILDPNQPRATRAQSVDIVKYYIIPGKRTLAVLKHVHQLYTLHGIPVNVTHTANDGVMINSAHVIEGDIEASNGVIHVIDHLIPPQDVIDAVYRNHTEFLPPDRHISSP